MAVTHRVLPSDRLVAAYNLLLACVWAAFLDRGAHVPGIVAAHAAAAALPWLLARARPRQWGLGSTLRETYPLLLIGAFWTELDLLRNAAGPGGHDAIIQRLDRAVFGTHLHAEWMPRMDAIWLSETMFFLYYAYYALIFLPPIVAAIQGRRDAVRDMTLGLMAAYLTCYVVYIAFPVYGPHFLHPPHQGPHTDGLFYRLVAAAQAAGDSRGCAFPSSHVAGAVTIAILGWRWFSRPVAALLSFEALGVVVSTVYTQNHYAIDSVMGIVWAVAVQFAVVPVWRRIGTAAVGPRVPPLPEFASPLHRADTTGGAR
jgi:membrane-associated phospholipid phosphatase